jgi:hypothetical protein
MPPQSHCETRGKRFNCQGWLPAPNHRKKLDSSARREREQEEITARQKETEKTASRQNHEAR